MNFHVITPSARHDRLGVIASNLANAKYTCIGRPVEICWHVVFTDPFRVSRERRIRRIDAMISGLPTGWFYFLSDDNLMPPLLPAKVADLGSTYPDVRAFHFSQIHQAGIRRGVAENLRHGLVDGGQCVLDVDYYRSFGWSYDHFGENNHEGRLFQEMKASDPTRWLHCPDVFCYHDGQAFAKGTEIGNQVW